LQILDVIGEPYVCCAGMFPCGPCGDPQDRNCAWLEACCCTSLAIAGNRFLIQTRLDKQNTACDDCLLWFTCLASWSVCLCNCAGCDVPDEIENCVEWLKVIVDGCMLAQQQYEIDHVQKTGWFGPNPSVVAALPPLQQQMIQQGRPMGPVAAAGVVAGGLVGGAAGAAVMYPPAPVPQTMLHPAPGRELYPRPAPVVMNQGGFMGTVAPNGFSLVTVLQRSAAGD